MKVIIYLFAILVAALAGCHKVESKKAPSEANYFWNYFKKNPGYVGFLPSECKIWTMKGQFVILDTSYIQYMDVSHYAEYTSYHSIQNIGRAFVYAIFQKEEKYGLDFPKKVKAIIFDGVSSCYYRGVIVIL